MKKPATELTDEQKDFIQKNRLRMSIKAMSIYLRLSFYKVDKYMTENNLSLSKDEIYFMKLYQNKQKNERIQRKDFWNMRINPITYF